ncbi:MAG: isoprenylcysteine carboxylmethyltransferase family protein [Cyanobacteria bacterium P01_E01_bin.34]
MQPVLKTAGLVASLVAAIAILIALPAAGVGLLLSGKILALLGVYFCFFLSTVWRVARFGKLAQRDDDEQVQNSGGQLAAILTVCGLLGVHWLAMVEFAFSQIDPIALVSSISTWIGFGLMAIAIVLGQVAIRTLGKFFDRLTIKADHQLVREGIYSVIRHPIYTSYILLFVGYCVVLQGWLSLGLLSATCLIWLGSRLSIEERMLVRQFGDDYRQYCQQTKRLFPLLY